MLTLMRSKHAIHSRSRSLSDPLARALLPPADESPAARDARVRQEQEAKKRSEEIDEQIRQDRAAMKRQKQAVKVLLLGQSESGKSTTLKRMFALLFSFFLSCFSLFVARCSLFFVVFML